MPLDARQIRMTTRLLSSTVRTEANRAHYLEVIFGDTVPEPLHATTSSPRDFAIQLIHTCNDSDDIRHIERLFDVTVQCIDPKKRFDAQQMRARFLLEHDENAGLGEAVKRIHEAIQFGETSLNLRELRLTTLPPEIGQCKAIEVLYLGWNQIKVLPPEIGQMTNLKQLYLASEKKRWMGGSNLKTLPPEIGELRNLEVLLAANNELEDLPPEIGKLENLRELDLGHNQLTALPPEIGQLGRLELLWLQTNRLSQLPDTFKQLSVLRLVNINENALTSFPPALLEMPHVQHISLNNNQLTTLPDEIRSMTGLQSLNASHNQLDCLPEALAAFNPAGLYIRHGNPLRDIPTDVVEGGEAEILAWLRTR